MKLFFSLLSLFALPAFAGIQIAQVAERPNPIEKTRAAVAAADQNNAAVEEVLDSTADSLATATDGSPIEDEAAEDAAEADSTPPERTSERTADAPSNAGRNAESGGAEAATATSTEKEAPTVPEESLVRFDMNYTDTPVRLILQNVADAAELNVIIPDDLLENTTIRLAGVTWPVLFDTVLENTGFTWSMGEDGIIRVKRIGADQAIELSETGLVSVNFRNEPTRSAVQALAEAVGLNIVIPADLDGSTSASLTNVAWERVLTEILNENDYQWFEDDGIIGIRKVDSRVVLDLQTGLLSINVEGIPFAELLTLLGQTQTPVVNVISAPEIKDLPVDLTVQGVSFAQAIDLAIGQLPRVTSGEGEGATILTYTTYELGPNVIQVVDSAFLARLRNEPPVVRIFDLRYASAGDLLLRIMPSPADTTESSNNPIPSFRQAGDGIQPVVDGVRSIAADHANNLLLVTAQPASLPEVASLIERLDQPLKQILIESKFVEVTGQDQRNLGIDWASLRGWGVTAGPFTREWDRSRSQTDTTTNTTNRDSSARDATSRSFDSSNFSDRNRLDSQTSTITDTSGVVTTEDISDTSDILDSNNLSSSSFNRDIDSSFETSSSFTQTIQNVASTARADTAIFRADEFRLILRALEEESDAKLITNPNVVAINGKQATVELTDYFYKPGPTETSEGVTTRGQPEPLEPRPGTTLKVTPTVVGGQLISLNVVPQVNSVVGTQTIDGNEIPTVRRRATESEVLLRSGSTLAIGGLITDENQKDTNKVPVLGDIPIIGRLFSSESTNVQTTNQIIFITASLLNPQTDTYMDVIGIDRFNALGLTDREVQGVGAVRLTDEEMELQQAVRRARNEAAEEELLRSLRLRKQVDETEEATENGEAAEETTSAGDSNSSERSSSRNFGPISRR